MYANVFRSTLEPITDMADADQVHHFINGLQPALKAKVWAKLPQTLSEAITQAVTLEAITTFSRGGLAPMYHHGGRSTGGHSHPAASASSGSVPMDINKIGQEHHCDEDDDEMPPPPRFHEERAASQVDSAAARIAELEHRLAALNNAANFKGSRGGDRVPGLKSTDIARLMKENKCFRCKKTGHVKRDCPLQGNGGSVANVSQQAPKGRLN